MDFRLEVFMAVANYLNLTKAAKSLAISQPAVSKHIHELESRYGVVLFNREARRVSLTAEGKLFLEHVKIIDRAYKDLEKRISFIDGNILDRRGEIKVGASMALSEFALGRYLSDYTTHFSNIRFDITTGTPDGLFSLLKKGVIDIAFLENYNLLHTENLYFPLMKYKVLPVVGRESFSDKLSFVFYKYGELVPLFDKAGYGKMEDIDVIAVTDTIKNMMDIVSSGTNRVAFLPSFVVDKYDSDMVREAGRGLKKRIYKLFPFLEECESDYEVGLFTTKSGFRNDIVNHFISYLQRFCR